MTSPSRPDGPERPPASDSTSADERLPPEGSASADEPLPQADEPLPEESGPAAEPLPGAAAASGDADDPAYAISPGGSFAAGFARQHHFSGARFLKPGRRVAVALAGVVGIAVVGVGLAAGVSHFGSDGHASVAATEPLGHTTAAHPSATGSPSRGATTATTTPGTTSPAKPPAGRQPVTGGTPAGGNQPLQPAAPPPVSTGSTQQSSGTGGSTPKPPAKPPAKPITFQGALIVNMGSKRCLAGQGGSRNPGTVVVLADCDKSDPSQGWTFPSDGTARDFAGTMCLDVAGSDQEGAVLRLENCSSSRHSTQAFVLKPSYDLVEVQPDLCADAKDKGTAAGTVIQVWTCYGTSNQKWQMP
ncbi:RICIN domain-containing protein [Actinacidiphila acidipaludis]|uniref:RICIN domain-containing protein n=1 Tax=Actinacidiphila acidipaludis TaxID=2873382 RepID=A0ABS7QGL3_9ACTN|nr:RICIN domain-containing protein [Streptomyces acidipaludis]MBY8882309.1 RICIN domain-containing protein [Streptomyces acidipaludis]